MLGAPASRPGNASDLARRLGASRAYLGLTRARTRKREPQGEVELVQVPIQVVVDGPVVADLPLPLGPYLALLVHGQRDERVPSGTGSPKQSRPLRAPVSGS
jgi:hypothetical protein